RYALHASCGIPYNHESPRRPLDFLPRKVAAAAAEISLGKRAEVWLGDLDARRDWGYAGDYVRAMRLMLRQDEPDDYVIASGESHTVEELVTHAFEHVGLDWREYEHIDESLGRRRARVRVARQLRAAGERAAPARGASALRPVAVPGLHVDGSLRRPGRHRPLPRRSRPRPRAERGRRQRVERRADDRRAQ